MFQNRMSSIRVAQRTAVWFALLLTLGFSRAQEGARRDPGILPIFSQPGGVFSNEVSVVLSPASGDGAVHFTIDGSEPTAVSPRYGAPLTLTNSTVIRARLFKGLNAAGPVLSQSYVLLEPDVLDFSSNLPLLLINTLGQEITKEGRIVATLRIIDTQGGRSFIRGASDFEGRSLINLRGRASLRYPKRSFTLKTVGEEDDIAKVPLLGMPKESDWVLYAPYPDKTLMRDVLAYELSNKIGRWAPRTKFVEVFLNEGGGKIGRRDYVGVYVLEEKVKRDKNRVNVENLGPQDNSEPALTGGYIFKKDHSDTGDAGPMFVAGPAFQAASSSSKPGFPTGPAGFPGDPAGFQPSFKGTVRSSSSSSSSSRSSRSSRTAVVTNHLGFPQRREMATLNRTVIRGDEEEMIEVEEEARRENFRSLRTNKFYYVDPEADELTGVQRAWLQNYVNRTEAALYGPGFKNPSNGYAAFIDVDSAIDYHLLIEVTKNVDGFRFSTFFHKDRGGKIKLGPIWDWNLSFGNCNGKQGYLPEWWLWPQLDDKEYSWYRRLFEDPDFGQKYVDRWTELRGSVFASSNLLARIDEMASSLQESQVRNFQRWPILGMAISPNWYAGDTYADEVHWMKGWISNRLDWIEKQFIQPPRFSQEAGQKLGATAVSGKIVYTLDGSDPRTSGGALAANALTYDAPIEVVKGGTVFARAFQGGRWSGPAIYRSSR